MAYTGVELRPRLAVNLEDIRALDVLAASHIIRAGQNQTQTESEDRKARTHLLRNAVRNGALVQARNKAELANIGLLRRVRTNVDRVLAFLHDVIMVLRAQVSRPAHPSRESKARTYDGIRADGNDGDPVAGGRAHVG